MKPRVPFLSRRLAIAAGLLLSVVLVGTIGFAALERWSWFDALYFTVMNVTTVGSAQPTDVAGKWWTILIVAVGFGVLTYTVLALVGYVIEGHLGDAFEQRRMRRRVARMTGHYIV
ncbi:MAG: voltage-gated potassium channel, partial [Candidatus Eremiobacteraeota bacterium]|nr:voltage-gated potassium channel [Candidatus Eremiobacteraeota bacterium]